MFWPTSFFSTWSILIWFAKKLVGQNMNIWMYTPPINVLVTSLQGSNAYPFYKNYKLWLLSSVKFWSTKFILGVNRYFSSYSLSDISKHRCFSSGLYPNPPPPPPTYLHNDTSGTWTQKYKLGTTMHAIGLFEQNAFDVTTEQFRVVVNQI